MQHKSSNLPYLLLLFPILHIGALSYFIPEGQESGFWQIGATAFLMMDILFVLILLALLKLPPGWRTREIGLLFVGCLIVMFWLMGSKEAMGNCFSGGHLLAFILSVAWLNQQKHLREQK